MRFATAPVFAALCVLGVLALALPAASAFAAPAKHGKHHARKHGHRLPAARSERPQADPKGPGQIHFGGPAALEQVSYPAGVERLHYRYGPLFVTPGTNLILIGNKTMPKPEENGYVVGLTPSLTLANGKIPPVDELHLHHGVWLSTAGNDASTPGLPYQRFFATGEEKTQLHLPAPYGYPVGAGDKWVLNYMIHNLTERHFTVFIDYEVDFVPLNSPLGQSMKPARPIWMDIRNGEAYPVFNTIKGSGSNGTFTYPDQDPGAYSGSKQLDEWTVDRPGTLIWTGGHLHPGGLYDTLEMTRPGAQIAPVAPGQPAPVPGAQPNSVRLFRSTAHYYDPRGPISWDLTMGVTAPDWRVAVKPGDTLRTSTTYDSKRASWYEGMGIMLVWMSEDQTGLDPFTQAVDQTELITHERMPENVDSGGASSLGLPDPRRLPSGRAPHNTIDIREFAYEYGGFGLPGGAGNPPTIKVGHSLTFVNLDNSKQIYHTITACQDPCMLASGISYPLANGPIGFDSAELGTGLGGFTAASNRTSWKTPKSLPPGTYTYFCRIHPFMRGSFRVVRR